MCFIFCKKILSHKQCCVNGINSTLYEIKWKGYDNSYNSWEPEENISKAAKDYYQKNTKSEPQKSKHKD